MKKIIYLLLFLPVIGFTQVNLNETTGGTPNSRPNLGISHTGAPGSVFFAGSDNHPTENNANLNFDNANGRLGIGTASPADKLHVIGNIRLSGSLRPNGLDGTVGQVLTSAGAGVAPTWGSVAAQVLDTPLIKYRIPFVLEDSSKLVTDNRLIYRRPDGTFPTFMQFEASANDTTGFIAQTSFPQYADAWLQGKRQQTLGFLGANAVTSNFKFNIAGYSPAFTRFYISVDSSHLRGPLYLLANTSVKNDGAFTNTAWFDDAGQVMRSPTDSMKMTINGTSQNLSNYLTNGLNVLQDADKDTKIQVEESTDEDIIRFDIAGTEEVTLDGTGFNIGTNDIETDAGAGTAGQVLTHDGDGTMSYQTVAVQGANNGLQVTSNNVELGSGTNAASGTSADLTRTTYIPMAGNDVSFVGTTNGVSAPVMKLQNNGNVGVGLTSPIFKLDVGNKKIGIDGTQMVYYPQGNFTGTIIFGTGGGSLSHTSGNEGWYNTFVGVSAGLNTTSGYFNSGMGFEALRFNTTGYQNTAIGLYCLRNNSAGYENTSMGGLAMLLNTTGYKNTAIGSNALRSNTTGYGNVAIGEDALFFNSTGFQNTAIGSDALRNTTTGNSNVAFGDSALGYNTTGTNNIALGYRAGRETNTAANNTNNSYCIYIGDDVRSGGNSITNEIVFGQTAQGLGENTVVLGNNAVVTTALKGNVGIATVTPSARLDIVSSGTTNATTALEVNNAANNILTILDDRSATFNTGTGTGVNIPAGTSSWVSNSDRRLKENINPITYGLNTVMAMNPSTYKYISTNKKSLGFIAQEMEEVVPEVVSENPDGYLGISYTELIPVLVKAIQEQQAVIESLENRIKILENK